MDPPPLISQGSMPEMWQFPLAGIRIGHRDASGGESTVTDHSGRSRGRRKLRDPAAGSEDDSSKLVSTSSGNDLTDCEGKRLKVNGDPKVEAEESSGLCIKPTEQNVQPSEPSKQDYIHVRARRGQATDSHSLAERARREKISERMKILQELVPGCNKVIGKASILDEIINYIQALQRQVEFLSMKLEAVNTRMNSDMEGFPPRDLGEQGYDPPSNLAFSTPQPTREYIQASATDWLHMQVGGAYERVT